MIILKCLDDFIPYQHFKIKGLHFLKYMLEENNFLCKIDLKDVYFLVLLSKQYRSHVRFVWWGSLFEFLYLYLGLPKIFAKLMKIPIALLRSLNICLVIYLDSILIMGRTSEETSMSRNTLIFLL